ncbi:MAG: ATP-binding cassette domain-containing protein [Zavarzinia sp.]|nr:ATP-binding cassette domain-containing protein [Zavarzinia sp.]
MTNSLSSPPVTAPARLAVERLTVEFGGGGGWRRLGGVRAPIVRAVDDVSFAIAPGETLGLVGESGSGKTTVGRALVGLVRPTGGSLMLDGQDLSAIGRAGRRGVPRRIQMMFQDPYGSLNPRFSVRETLAEVLRFHHIVPPDGVAAEVRRMMDLVGLPASLADRMPRHLSGGQRQRVGLARALAVRPSVLVLDEPVAALDVSIQAQVLNLLQDLRDTLDLTMLFIAHELGVVRYVSDKVAVMYLGAVMETGSAAEVFTRPAHPYTRSLLDAMPHLIADKRSRPPVLGGEGGEAASGCRFRARCPRAGDACAVAPPLVELSAGHGVACHFPAA